MVAIWPYVLICAHVINLINDLPSYSLSRQTSLATGWPCETNLLGAYVFYDYRYLSFSFNIAAASSTSISGCSYKGSMCWPSSCRSKYSILALVCSISV